MKQIYYFLLFIFVFLSFSGCKSDGAEPKDPVAAFLKKISFRWVIQSASEGGTVVFDTNNPSNFKVYYGKFILDLSNSPTVRLTEVDGQVYTGKFVAIETTRILTLSALVPQPFNTNGNITYTIESVDDTTLILIRTEENPKTGISLTKYILKKS